MSICSGIVGGHNLLEYVASGCSHTRITAQAVFDNPEILKLVTDYLGSLEGKNNHHFSLLYNAFVEKNFGPKFKDYYKGIIHNVHADSGGLQIITRGKVLTNEMKDEVYRNQARYSDVAMSFDEIPISFEGTQSNKNDALNRYFDKEKFEHYARQSGKNIKRQIEIFMDESSVAKPLIIAHGNCYETYMSWVEYILEEIPPSYYDKIGGLAMGSAALGNGPLEDIERAIYAARLPFQAKDPYIHVLGVGSMRRLLPYLALLQSGFYPKGIKVSYDSTTHTQGPTFGTYFLDNSIRLTKDWNHIWDSIYRNVDSKYDLVGRDINRKTFWDFSLANSSVFQDDTGELLDKDNLRLYFDVKLSWICSAIDNFTRRADECVSSEKELLRTAARNKVQNEIYALIHMKTIEDFLQWKDNNSADIRSKRVSVETPNNIEGFFE